MGSGYWTRESFVTYSKGVGRTVDAKGHLDRSLNDSQLFRQRGLHPMLDPKGVMRECCDSAEHPETIPVILALDVTGSMGAAAAEVARKLNEVMTRLYGEVKDVEFCVMGIGDLAYDRAPIQISQFESDVRIAEQLDQIYLEHGGGGNRYESYTAAWYMGLHHTCLDCWKRGRRGLIITMGDETLNPYLPCEPLAAATGDGLQQNVETPVLYREAVKKFNLYHLFVEHGRNGLEEAALKGFGELLGKQHVQSVSVEGIAEAIVKIVKAHAEEGKIAWKTDRPAEEKKPGFFRNLISW